MFNPADIPASKQEFMSAVDRQFPPKTDAERAVYKARRAVLAAEPVPVWVYLATSAAFAAIPFVYWFVSL